MSQVTQLFATPEQLMAQGLTQLAEDILAGRVVTPRVLVVVELPDELEDVAVLKFGALARRPYWLGVLELARDELLAEPPL
jgi:hypothetical protein